MEHGLKSQIKHIYFYARVQGVRFPVLCGAGKPGSWGLPGGCGTAMTEVCEMEVEGAEAYIDQLILFLQNRT